MSYFRKTEYEMIPEGSFSVIRSCSGCGRKTRFTNTGKFRINANGNKLDVWLIYQCESCKHTFNLSIYERLSASGLSPAEYRRFLDNDSRTAEMYGRDSRLFQRNRAEIDSESLSYKLVPLPKPATDGEQDGPVILTIHNPCGLKVRPEKQVAAALGLSTSQVRKMIREGGLVLTQASSHTVSVERNDCDAKSDGQ